MAILEFQTIMRPLLELLEDGQPRSTIDIRDVLAKEFSLTDQDLAETTPRGRQLRWVNQVAWALHHLSRACMISKPQSEVHRITDRGRDVLVHHPTSVDVQVCAQFDEWHHSKARRNARGPSSHACRGRSCEDSCRKWRAPANIGVCWPIMRPTHVVDANGARLRTEFSVEPDHGAQSVVLASASGSLTRDYNDALALLLRRLAAVDAVSTDGFIESRNTRRLSEADRRLVLRHGRRCPIHLRSTDIDEPRKAIDAAQAPIGQRPGATADNRTKRIRLVISPGGSSLPRDLEARLSTGTGSTQ